MGTRNGGVHRSVDIVQVGLLVYWGALVEARQRHDPKVLSRPGYWQPDWMPWVVCRITSAWLDVLHTAKTPSNEIVLPLV